MPLGGILWTPCIYVSLFIIAVLIYCDEYCVYISVVRWRCKLHLDHNLAYSTKPSKSYLFVFEPILVHTLAIICCCIGDKWLLLHFRHIYLSVLHCRMVKNKMKKRCIERVLCIYHCNYLYVKRLYSRYIDL